MFKRILLSIGISLFTVAGLQAQDSLKIWKKGGSFGLNLAQTGLKNWVSGGQNSLSVTGLSSLYLNLDRPKLKWTNQLDMGFGLLRQGKDSRFYKSDDKMIFVSKLSKELHKKLFFSILTDFRSQFAPGHEFYKDSVTGDLKKKFISRFMAPGYLVFSPGLEYRIKDEFYVLFTPLSGKFTFVLSDTLSNLGSFGVTPGRKIRSEIGSYVTAGVKKKLATNISLATKLSLFSNYKTYGDIDVNWEMLLLMKVNKYITTTLSCQLLYDDDIKILKDNGTTGPGIQFKEVINVGLLYELNR